jgi:RNA polymerase primary sigma factor
MRIMLNEIRATAPLTVKEEQVLFCEYKKADVNKQQKIKTKIINSNMRFVLQAALNYKNMPSVDVKELVTEGKLGLLDAFDKFDVKRNIKFFSFAAWSMKCNIAKYLETTDLIKLPAHQKVKLNKARRTIDDSDFTEEVKYLNEIAGIHASLDSTLNNTDLPIFDVVRDDKVSSSENDHYKNRLKINLLESLSKILTEEEVTVITNIYGIATGNPLPLRDVSEIIDKSHERVRQIRDKAMRTLRKSKDIEKFKAVFGSILNE